MFVHRNVANIVVHTDLNCLSVVQFAIEALGVPDIIVCGHYGCGGVSAAMEDKELGLIDNWIRNIRDVYRQNLKELEEIENMECRANRLAELNIIRQVINLGNTTIVEKAWSKRQDLQFHGWIYGLKDGLLKDLGVNISSQEQLREAYRVERS